MAIGSTDSSSSSKQPSHPTASDCRVAEKQSDPSLNDLLVAVIPGSPGSRSGSDPAAGEGSPPPGNSGATGGSLRG